MDWFDSCFNPPIDRCEKKFIKLCLSRKIYLSLPLTRMISVSIKLWQVWRYQQKDIGPDYIVCYYYGRKYKADKFPELNHSEEIINCYFFFSFTKEDVCRWGFTNFQTLTHNSYKWAAGSIANLPSSSPTPPPRNTPLTTTQEGVQVFLQCVNRLPSKYAGTHFVAWGWL